MTVSWSSRSRKTRSLLPCIIIPDTAKEKPMQGKVLAAGPGSRGDDGKLTALDVKKGDKVLYGKWSGTEVKLDGKTMLIMRESDIMGVMQ